jgi:hypothetical protein
MNEDNFIARWSRRKREAESEKRLPKRPEPPQASPEQQPTAGGEMRPEAEPPFDPATLPPLESIVANTDIRAFLQKGVPAELTKAALRRAWSADPAIRDFIEIAENQWDFTDPSSIPGFGPLRASDDVGQLVSQAMGQLSPPQPPGPVGEEPNKIGASATEMTPESQPVAAGSEVAGPSEAGKSDEQTAPRLVASPQTETEAACESNASRRKGHGGAMPR